MQAMQVCSYHPEESWAELVKHRPCFQPRISLPLPPKELARPRPDPSAPLIGAPATGAMGPGAYTFNERLTRKTPLCHKVPTAQRFDTPAIASKAAEAPHSPSPSATMSALATSGYLWRGRPHDHVASPHRVTNLSFGEPRLE